MENRINKKVNLDEMKALAYFLMSSFRLWIINESYDKHMSELEYVDYHNFSKTRLPFYWYEDLLKQLNLTVDDVLVEIAKVSGDHNNDLHYHKISHALCIILGPKTGFNDCYFGEVVKDSKVLRSNEGLEVYFPSFCTHTFNAFFSNETGPLYFLSIQSPSLLTKKNDDFYFVNK